MAAAGLPLHRTAWLGLFAGVTLVATWSCSCVIFCGAESSRSPSDKHGKVAPADLECRSLRRSRHDRRLRGLAGPRGRRDQHYPGFTQLWLLHRDQNARTVNLGVANHEGRTIRYRLVLSRNGRVAAMES